MENDLQAVLPKAERDLVVHALQALWRERVSAFQVAERVSIERNAPPVDGSAFGIEEAARMLRRFGAVPFMN